MKNIKLICLPYAGSSAFIYEKWKQYLKPGIELYPVDIAGRGERMHDPFCKCFDDAVQDIYSHIQEIILGRPYALWGHSMAGLLCFELIHMVYSENAPEPIHLFVSGCRPPHRYKKGTRVSDLSDEEFMKEISVYGGTPTEIFESSELAGIFLPILRADYRMMENYRFIPRSAKVRTNVTILGGRNDEEVPWSFLPEWRRYIEKRCDIILFDGGHFFIHDYKEEVSQIINRILEPGLSFS